MLILIALCYFFMICGLGVMVLAPPRPGMTGRRVVVFRYRRPIAVGAACLLVPPLLVHLLTDPTPALPG